jgi:hypothetical protein
VAAGCRPGFVVAVCVLPTGAGAEVPVDTSGLYSWPGSVWLW